jgi:hypothetical protein
VPAALPSGREPAFAPPPLAEPASPSLPVVVERRGTSRATRAWVLRLGAHDDFARVARDGGFAAVDWGDSDPPPRPDGSSPPRRDDGRRPRADAPASALRAALRTADAARFFHEVGEGDLVVVPNPAEGLVHLGRDVARHDLPLRVALALEGPAALAAVEVSDDAIAALFAGEGAGRSDRAALLRSVVTALSAAPEADVRELVRALLSALGFSVATAEGDARELWRLTGVLSSAGLADVPARAWVRGVRDAMGSDVVQDAREELRLDERGVVATLGTFTPQARAAAGDAVRLLDGETLAALALEHWDRLPPRARDALGLRRSERTTVEVRFQPL